MTIQLKYDINQLNSLRKSLDSKNVNRALRDAVTTATRRVRTYISRDIRDVYPLKASDLSKSVKIRRYDRGATQALVYTGGRLPLSKFKPTTRMVRITATSRKGKKFKTRRRQARVLVRKDKGRQVVERGWYAKGEIMRRATDANNSQPHIQYGPSIPGMVAHDTTMAGATQLAREILPQEFSRRLESLMENS